MGRFSKHLDLGEPVKINDEDFTLRPLGVKYMSDFLKLMKVFSKMEKDKSMETFFDNLDDESIEIMKRLLLATLEKSFPDDWNNNKDELEEFGMKYMFVFIPKIFELNSADVKDVDKSDKMKKRLEEMKSASSK